MDEPPPVTERADGYVQDLASQWVADSSGPSRATGSPTCAPRPAARPPRLAERAGRRLRRGRRRPAAAGPADRRQRRSRSAVGNLARGRRRRRRAAAAARPRSTGCWSTRRARASARCAAAPTPAGGSRRATSARWPPCSARILAAAAPLVRPAASSSTACAR